MKKSNGRTATPSSVRWRFFFAWPAAMSAGAMIMPSAWIAP
jgi:hypothetical protein